MRSITLDNTAALLTTSGTTPQTQQDLIRLTSTSGDITLTNNSVLSTRSEARGGDISLDSSQNIGITESAIDSSGSLRGGDLSFSSSDQLTLSKTLVNSGYLDQQQIDQVIGQGIVISDLIQASDPNTPSDAGSIELRSWQNLLIEDSAILFSGNSTQNGIGDSLSLTSDLAIVLNNDLIRGDTGLNLGRQLEISGSSVALNQTRALLTTSGVSSQASQDTIGITSTQGDISLTDSIVSTRSSAQGGDITLNSKQNIQLSNSAIDSAGDVSSGDIRLLSRHGGINLNRGFLNSGFLNEGQLVILERDNLNIPRPIFTQLTDPNGTGNGGLIELASWGDIILQDSVVFFSGNPLQGGSAGSLNILSDWAVNIDRSLLRSSTGANGGGQVNIDAQVISLRNAELRTRGQTQTNARTEDIMLNARTLINLDSAAVSTETRTSQSNGNIFFRTPGLIVQNGAIVSSSNSSDASKGGLIDVEADHIEIVGTNPDTDPEGIIPSSLASLSLGRSDAGDINIRSHQLWVRDGGVISTGTTGEGQGGNITIHADDSVKVSRTASSQLFGSGIVVDTFGAAPAGDLQIFTPVLEVTGGGLISASTSGNGTGGDITIEAWKVSLQGTSSNETIPSGIYAQGFSTGRSGGISLQTDELVIKDQARIVVDNDSQTEDPAQALELSRRLLDALRQIPEANIPDETILDMDLGSGDAGDINIDAQNALLSNQAQITARTASGQGGNINLAIWDSLTLRHQSQISTTAGRANAGGDGGNITIEAPNGFIITRPIENNDITANAFTGSGGRVFIRAAGIFGTEFRDFLTPLSEITASSVFGPQGDVVIVLTEPDATQGLNQLPVEPRDPAIADSCQNIGGRDAVELLQVGRGGLPRRPDEPLNAGFDWLPPIEPENDISSDFDRSVAPVTRFEQNHDRSLHLSTVSIPIAACQR